MKLWFNGEEAQKRLCTPPFEQVWLAELSSTRLQPKWRSNSSEHIQNILPPTPKTLGIRLHDSTQQSLISEQSSFGSIYGQKGYGKL